MSAFEHLGGARFMWPDFSGWQRADVISALSLGVSLAAFAVSLAAAFASFIQARSAWLSHRLAARANDPIAIDAAASRIAQWDGYLLVSFTIRNRFDHVITLSSISASSIGYRLTYRAAIYVPQADVNERRILLPNPPPIPFKVLKPHQSIEPGRTMEVPLFVAPAPGFIASIVRLLRARRYLRIKILTTSSTASMTSNVVIVTIPQPRVATPQ
ncbi:hypothetical protein EYW49_08960 [Siculibacillus lacustris]|uniref:Uncharacterized protein n=1 Tax=Siculibacillus lacustris TaxID=1549641 RepID=A0A4Q9VUU8_9HYPH|nr:hypothetical protein [Siculibacillus lacustris]TBW38808.1 hypothetical protein EYW49_08960 [Siculibacillus lacustris]